MNRWGTTASPQAVTEGIAEARKRLAKITGGYRYLWQIPNEEGRFPCRSGAGCTATLKKAGDYCSPCRSKLDAASGEARVTPCRAKCGGTVLSVLKYPLCEACRKASQENGGEKKWKKAAWRECSGCGSKIRSTAVLPVCSECRQRRPEDERQAERERWEQERAA